MGFEDIDDFLANIDEDGEEISIPEEPIKDIKRYNNSSGLPSKQKIVNKKTKDLSFLDDIDSEKSLEYSDNDEITERNSKDVSGIIDKDLELDIEEHRTKTSDRSEKEYKAIEFIVKGTKTWNTRRPYIAPVNYDKLNADYIDLLHTFYFIKEQEKESVIIGEMKRAMFKFIRGSGKNIIEEYSEFIKNNISLYVHELCNDFGFQGDRLYFFVYHLGVWIIYKIILSEFQVSKLGYCFKLVTGNNVVKYIPSEFVKEITLGWHNDNFKDIDLPFDAIFEFNELKRQISSYYMKEVERNNNKIDDLIAKSDQNLITRSDREQFFKSKWVELFGKSKIFVYNRFLERTIFKTSG